MASELLSSSLGRNLLFGASIGLGLGVGIGAGFIVARKFVTLKVGDCALVVCLSELTQEIKALREALCAQQNSHDTDQKPSRPVRRARSVNSVQRESTHVKSDDDSDEEFFETADVELLAVASGEIERAWDTDQIRTVIQEADELFSAGKVDDNKLKVHKLLEEATKEFGNDADLTWRYSKSCYELAMMRGRDGDQETKKTLLYEGVKMAEQAVQLDDNSADAHKWFAILIGSIVEYESVHNQVKLGFDYKEHISKAIDLNDRDASAYHLLGRWCFEISNMSWWQRKAASAFIAEPPTSSVDEALDNFLKAEELDPGFWLSNVVWIGKCYNTMNKSEEAKTWFNKALSLQVQSDDDQEAIKEAKQLLASL